MRESAGLRKEPKADWIEEKKVILKKYNDPR